MQRDSDGSADENSQLKEKAPASPDSAPRPEQVAEQLRGEIVTGLWPIDADLPPERELMRRFGVSRPTYRESLRLLESQGLIKRKRGAKGGARILRPSATPVTRYAGAYLQAHGATGEDIWRGILLIEPAAVRAVTERGEPATLAALAASLERQRDTTDDRERFFAEERRFRMTLLEGSGSVTLALLGTMLYDLAMIHSVNIVRLHANEARSRRHMEQSLDSKAKLLRFIEVGAAADAEALWARYASSGLQRTQGRAESVGLLQFYATPAPAPEES